ncbi:hypothetical protein BpHYR1_020804 [Brachionus plicatilis]|uniref:Uncharacterized protein n=1 Tax=Brachionus plicatilis TaxID=10195 RepID=A0A3M7PUR8_BRAPC|nr:hypothetical protein BpHYR1_020804 [Brachionus plicatilis]
MNVENKCTFKFKKPTILAFMGIPGSGKSTIAREISRIINSSCYLENEEDHYPERVHKEFLNKRNRLSEINENIYHAQKVFLEIIKVSN